MSRRRRTKQNTPQELAAARAAFAIFAGGRVPAPCPVCDRHVGYLREYRYPKQVFVTEGRLTLDGDRVVGRCSAGHRFDRPVDALVYSTPPSVS